MNLHHSADTIWPPVLKLRYTNPIGTWEVPSTQKEESTWRSLLMKTRTPKSHILNASTFTPIALTGMPDGLVRGVTVAPDDSAFAFYASDGSVPEDLYAGLFGAAPHRLTDALNPAIRREDLVIPTVVRFKSYDGLEIPGLLYKPHQASAEAKAAVLVNVHGGPGGRRKWDTARSSRLW